MMKKVGAAWKALPEQEKKQYETAAQQDRAKYAEAFQKYKSSGALDAWNRDPAKPKLPETAYLRYLAEFRSSEKAKNLKTKDIVSEGAKAWKTVDAAKKKTLQEKYEREKTAYIKAMKEYKDSGKELAWKKKVGIHDQEQKLAAKKAAEAQKEREKKLKQKLQEKAKKDKEKAKMVKGKEKEKAKLLREKALAKAKSSKEKEKLARTKAAEAEKLKKSKATKATKSKQIATKGAQSKEKATIKLQQEKQKKEATKLKLLLAEENRKYKDRMVRLQKQISERMSKVAKK